MNYLRTLALLHRRKRPRSYLEIGVRLGTSLAYAKCYSVGVDPGYTISAELRCDVRLYRKTSDDFFASDIEACKPPGGFDLIFIDGMHLFDYVLRDFINAERHVAKNGLIVVDDIYPFNAVMAQRDKQAPRTSGTNAWTGDVWKLLPTLRQLRPDLTLVGIDCAPTGLLAVAGGDPANRVLSQNIDTILASPENAPDLEPPADILQRSATLAPRAALAQLFPARATA